MVSDGAYLTAYWFYPWLLKMNSSNGLTLLVLLSLGANVNAQKLEDTYQAAAHNDADYLAEYASYQASVTKEDQAKALWRPTINAQAMAGRTDFSNQIQGAQFSAPGFPLTNGAGFNTSIVNGNLEQWMVTATQPLINGARHAQSQQLSLQAEMAEWQWKKAEQKLLQTTTITYFKVTQSAKRVQLLAEQLKAENQIWDETNEKFRLGYVKSTGLLEAESKREWIRAEWLSSQMELSQQVGVLTNMTGIPTEQWQVYSLKDTAIPDLKGTLTEWQKLAESQNPDLQIQQNAYQIALQATHEKDWESSPSVDLVGAYSHDRMSGSGSYGGSSTTLNNGVVGVQLTIPIYSGGMRSAQHNEQVRLEDQKLNEVIATRRQIHLAVQQAWMGYWTDIKKVNALELSVKASTERLDSTKLGFSIGDKTTLDVLNAQTDKTQGYSDWLLARQDLIDHWMDLMALTGMLAPESLVQVDQLLEKTPISLGALLQESEVNSITKGE